MTCRDRQSLIAGCSRLARSAVSGQGPGRPGCRRGRGGNAGDPELLGSAPPQREGRSDPRAADPLPHRGRLPALQLRRPRRPADRLQRRARPRHLPGARHSLHHPGPSLRRADRGPRPQYGRRDHRLHGHHPRHPSPLRGLRPLSRDAGALRHAQGYPPRGRDTRGAGRPLHRRRPGHRPRGLCRAVLPPVVDPPLSRRRSRPPRRSGARCRCDVR